VFTDVSAYDRYIGRYSPDLARKLIAAAGVVPTDRVLDVGCGPGALTSALVPVVGADHVTAVDPSPEYVAANIARNPGVDVREAPAESLPFPDATFDAALAQLVVNFMTNAHAGVGEMRRVTRIGGAVCGAVWDYGGEMTLLRNFWDAASTVHASGAVRDERQMRYATPDALAALWTAVGLVEVAVQPAVASANYESFEDLWQPLEAGVGPAGAYTASLEDDHRERLKVELRRRLDVGEDPFELTARAWVVTGRVP
jgi:SAM-dependent methyltransferase